MFPPFLFLLESSICYTAFGSGVSTEMAGSTVEGYCCVGYTAFGSGVSTEIAEFQPGEYGTRSVTQPSAQG